MKDEHMIEDHAESLKENSLKADTGPQTSSEENLREAVRVLEMIELNDRSKPYEYGEARPSDGALPGPGRVFNTPREFARYWKGVFADALASAEAVSASASSSSAAPGGETD